MKKLLLTAFAAALTLKANAQTYTPVALTGFNADVVANGAGSASSSTNNGVGTSGFAFVAENFVNPSNQSPLAAGSLPTNGTINSAITTGLPFQLAPYTGNNSLRLQTTAMGTLTFSTPIAAGEIYILSGSGNGTSTYTVTVNFTDATTQVFTGETTIDWHGTTTGAFNGTQRVERASSMIETKTNGPRLYQKLLTLNATNTSKLIQSIRFAKTTSTGVLNVMAITTKAPAPLVPNDVSATAITGVDSGCGLTNQETVTVTVANLGTTAQSNIPVSYSVNGTPTGTGTIAGPVAPGATATHTFTTKADLSTLGTYTIEAKTNLTGDATPTNDAFTKTVISASTPNAPVITASGATTLCTSSSVTLTAASTSTGVTYQWYKDGVIITNATSATYNANTAGSYTATAIVAGNCASPASAATIVTINQNPPAPSINHTSSLAVCSGDSVALTAVSAIAGATFTWFHNSNVIPGVTGATYMAKSAGSYTATATNNGCTSAASLARNVTITNKPATPTVTQAGYVLTSSSNSGNQWYKDNVVITGATSKTFTTTSNGSYTVKVTANGCTSAASNAVAIVNTGLSDDLNSLGINVYPNPSTGLFNIMLPEGKTLDITVTDLSGKIIRKQEIKHGSALLDLQKAAKGIYMLQIVTDGKTATRKLILE